MGLHKIWFPQIESSGSQVEPGPVMKALYKFYEIFGISTEGVFTAGIPLSATHNIDRETRPELFNLSALLKFLEEKKSLWAFGTFSTAQIEECSLQELGFNLFKLPGKIFNYVPIIPTPGVDGFFPKNGLTFTIEDIENEIHNSAIELLKWSMCKKVCQEIQKSFGHGQRDHFQGQSYEGLLTELKSLNIDSEEKWGWRDLPCPEECLLYQQVKQIMEVCQKETSKDGKCPKLARKIALMDCRKYRMAQSKYFAELYESTGTKNNGKFKKIIILEDNEGFRKKLINDLLQNQYVKFERDIVTADVKKSWENFCLWNKKWKDNLGKIFEDETIAPGEILACFDLELGKKHIPGTAMGNFMENIFGGQWILYNTGCVYPQIPKLVITGYRSQDLTSHIAGGSAFLVKPYTVKLLREQIKNARLRVRRHVTWLCPEAVQIDYSNLFPHGILGYEGIKKSLINWLDRKQVDLDIVESKEKIEDKELVIIDIFEKKMEEGNTPGIIMKLRKIISRIRTKNPGVQIILVLPLELERETAADYYKQLSLNLHDGSDNIIWKPYWYVLDRKTKPDECLGNMILEQLENKGNFDVKYQVLVPIAPIVGRLSARFNDILKKPGGKTLDQLYAPFLPYLIDTFGLAGRIADIAARGDEVKTKISNKIKVEKVKDKERWENIYAPDDSISTILEDLLNALKSSEINKYITLESWLRHIVDNKPGDNNPGSAIVNNGEDRKDILSLIEPLARVFGGSTRYEFSVRGSWYKGDKRIDDILIVVEFCAKSSIIGRKFIRETAVKYLSTVAGEDVVLVQEIPIKGFLWE